MNRQNDYVVVLRRTGFETVLYFGTKQECDDRAADYNNKYQTDEYKVEPRRA